MRILITEYAEHAIQQDDLVLVKHPTAQHYNETRNRYGAMRQCIGENILFSRIQDVFLLNKGRFVTVKSGDTLWNIVLNRYNYVTFDLCRKIAEYNRIADMDLITPGEILELPARFGPLR